MDSDSDTPASCSICLEALPPPAGSQEYLATLDCGHHYHDLCIKAWSERTNSCPSCRTTFNSVALRNEFAGPVIKYLYMDDRVAPKVGDDDDRIAAELAQQQEWDLEMDDLENCEICGSGEREQELLVCNGCQRTFHFTCLDLGQVPFCEWFCPSCEVDGDSGMFEQDSGWSYIRSLLGSDESQRPSRSATRSLISSARRQVIRSRNEASQSFERGNNSNNNSSNNGNGSSLAVGALEFEHEYGNRHGNGASSSDQEQVELPPEEAKAWQMFEQAMDLEGGLEPEEEQQQQDIRDEAQPGQQHQEPLETQQHHHQTIEQEQERKLKQPSRRRRQVSQSDNNTMRIEDKTESTEPSFLQSLLTDIRAPRNIAFGEMSSVAANTSSSNGSSSSSNPSTSSSPAAGSDSLGSSPKSLGAHHHHHHHHTPRSPLLHSKMPLEKKQKVQNLVRDALRPEYRAGKIDKDQYTRINKRVSRKMYDMIVGEDYPRYKDLARELVSNELNST